MAVLVVLTLPFFCHSSMKYLHSGKDINITENKKCESLHLLLLMLINGQLWLCVHCRPYAHYHIKTKIVCSSIYVVFPIPKICGGDNK